MTRTRVVLITSLAAFFSVAAVNYAAAQYSNCASQCRGVFWDSSSCKSCLKQADDTNALIRRRDELLRQRQEIVAKEEAQKKEAEARKREEEARKKYDALKARAMEERKIITCIPSHGNVQHCIQHGRNLLP
jgi:hypothetical protein